MVRVFLPFYLFTFLLLAASCQREDFNDGPTAPEAQLEIAFNTTVSSNRQSTRADATIVNMGETSLLPTATSNRKAGIFGCYTGTYTWAELVKLSGTDYADRAELPSSFSSLSALSDETAYANKKTEILNKYYTANLMFNVPATINSDGSLTYSPLQFWSNNPLPSPATGHEYMTFFAYYPYNESSTLGEYGISMFNDENGIGQGKGMGKVKFTMHADASKHNDFLISAPVTDCNRDKYPLQRTDNTPSYDPTPVQFRLYHMLAQVRFYVFINGNDKMAYEANVATAADLIRDDANVKQKDLDEDGDNEPAVMNELGEWVELKLGDQIPDESKCVRWKRGDVWNLNHTSRRPEITYTMELNNIHTTATFYPRYTPSGATIAYDDAVTLGSTTVNHYIMNPYWFTFKDGVRERLNDNYMFRYFEDTPVAKQLNATTTMPGYNDIDGWDWTGTNDPLDYLRTGDAAYKKELEVLGKDGMHYNFAPGNIMLVVPQTLSDDDVPHVVITAHGYDATTNAELTAKVTVNLLKMGISWESGYIYCYAFLDELRPGDDKVRGPESITTLINKEWRTDQW
ncbi:MAG: fimbrillin family protein [Prevotella sp.]|nr:fimbrillin family protein [Prevotella sp.]MBR0489821.1 fimbrillin family protein [Prevotella sp.]